MAIFPCFYLRKLTEKPHLAGTNESHELARELRDHWEAVGLDHVTMTPYKVLLSYPDPDDPNFVELLNENNETQYRSNTTEKILTPEEDKPGVVPPFNAYSAPGDIYVSAFIIVSYFTFATSILIGQPSCLYLSYLACTL
jgi:hypothetical protein